MAILVIAEHDNAALKSATKNTVTAAARLGGDIHVLVLGAGAQAAAAEAARLAGVSKVLLADNAAFAHGLAENLAPAIAGGNTVVFKPSEQTPLTALKMAKLLTLLLQTTKQQSKILKHIWRTDCVRPLFFTCL